MLCKLCPNKCNTDRDIKSGLCLADNKTHISYHGIHEWEEPVISGGKGSGAIFFSGCTMRCVFCQNAKISREVTGKTYSTKELVYLISEYDEKADNINLVSATPYTYNIIEALKIYKPKHPVIWNSSGYETIDTINELAKYVDVWLPDLKYVDSALSKALSGTPNYFKYAFTAIKRMIEISGKPVFENDLIKRGTIVRHLIIPSYIENTLDVLKVFADNFKDDALLSLMAQYTPVNVTEIGRINRRITPLEYKRALRAIDELNITNGFFQELSSAKEEFIPNF